MGTQSDEVKPIAGKQNRISLIGSILILRAVVAVISTLIGGVCGLSGLLKYGNTLGDTWMDLFLISGATIIGGALASGVIIYGLITNKNWTVLLMVLDEVLFVLPAIILPIMLGSGEVGPPLLYIILSLMPLLAILEFWFAITRLIKKHITTVGMTGN